MMMKMTMTAGLLVVLGAVSALAQTGNTDGEVRKVDKEAGKVTLRHGPIAGALEMPAMTMVFQVKDPALLDRLQSGDRVSATILKEDGTFFIQSAEKKPR
jgi:Cu(I)/Ag(I) efflux system protein CusF